MILTTLIMPVLVTTPSINSPNAELKANRLSQNNRRITDAIFFVPVMRRKRNTIPMIEVEIGCDRSIVIMASRDQLWMTMSVGKLIPTREKDAGISKSYAKNNTE